MTLRKACSQSVILFLSAVALALYMSGAWIARRSAFFDDFFIQEVKVVQNIVFFIVAILFMRSLPSERSMVKTIAVVFAVWFVAYNSVVRMDVDQALLSSFKMAAGLFEGILNALVMVFCLWQISKCRQKYATASVAAVFLSVEVVFDSALTWDDSAIFFARGAFSFLAFLLVVSISFFLRVEDADAKGEVRSLAFSKVDFVVMMLVVFVITFAFGFIRQLFSNEGRSDGLHNASNGVLMVALLIVSIFYYALRGYKDLKWIYAGSLCCFIASAGVLPFLYMADVDFYGAPLKCSWAIFQPLVYVTAVYVASSKRGKAVCFIGAFLGSLNSGVSAGILSAKLTPVSLSDGSADIALAALGIVSIIALVLLGVAIAYHESAARCGAGYDCVGGAVSSERETRGGCVEDPFFAKVRILSESASLTERERAILIETSHGFSAEKIACKMSCSPETVRTHLKSIYGKAGVTNKQDLLDLIDGLPQP